MKRVVSVSIGSSSRDKIVEAEFLGESFSVERVGTDGDFEEARRRIAELDGHVDAIGLGGIDLYLIAGGKRYVIRDARRLSGAAKQTPVVDGSGLKDTWERVVVKRLVERKQLHPKQGTGGMGEINVLVTSAVDRFGMGEELAAAGARCIFGDLIFGLGVPVPLKRMWQLRLVARMLLPIVCRQPFEKLYPTGEKQDAQTPKFGSYYRWADVIAGDMHFIKRFMPASGNGDAALKGKTILTNTTTEADVEQLRERGLARLITTTPRLEGRSFGTNVMEGVVVSLIGKKPEELGREDYMKVLDAMEWEPSVMDLT